MEPTVPIIGEKKEEAPKVYPFGINILIEPKAGEDASLTMEMMAPQNAPRPAPELITLALYTNLLMVVREGIKHSKRIEFVSWAQEFIKTVADLEKNHPVLETLRQELKQ